MKIKPLLFLFLGALLPLCGLAEVKLPAIFTDNMVLQRQSDVKIWGAAAPGRKVEVTPSWSGKTVRATADERGDWTVTVATPAAGGPYTVTISDGRPVRLKNVLIGEVWLCSGQSNMEMSMASGVFGGDEAIREADGMKQIRLLHIDNTTSPTPRADAAVRHGGWQVCSSATVTDFSAAGYFFGLSLYRALGVPVGLIESAWGGTLAESWTSAEALSYMPAFAARVEKVRTLPESTEERHEIFRRDIDEWRIQMAAADEGFENGRARCGEPSFDDTAWKEIEAPGFVQDQGLDGFSGFLWMRKTVDIPASWAGKELTLDLAMIDDNDFTYFNGVEVGHIEGCLTPRRYTVPAELVKAGKATVAVRVMDTGGKGGIWGDAGGMKLSHSAEESLPLAGTWKYKVSMGLGDAPEMPVNTATEPNYPTFLYNAMIHPLTDYTIRGAIWYQGEANVARADQYAELLPLMIRDWRRQWGYAFPFYIVQLPNYMNLQQGAEESEWAALREAQAKTLRLENTGLAVTIDVGEGDNLHPRDKRSVGERLALLARAKTYGERVACDGPLPAGYTLGDDCIRIAFPDADQGLKTADGGAVKGFYIAGSDRKFYPAEAVIEGSDVVVRSSEVPFPVAVRYAWANNPVCNLQSGAGLPASPFRTDDWAPSRSRF